MLMSHIRSKRKNFYFFSVMSENSQISSYDFNLSAFVKLPTVELSPNMLVLQNICKSPELSLPAVTINGQTKGKPKPQEVLTMQWCMIDFYFSFLLPCMYLAAKRLPSVFGPWVGVRPLPMWRTWARFSCLGVCNVLSPKPFELQP